MVENFDRCILKVYLAERTLVSGVFIVIKVKKCQIKLWQVDHQLPNLPKFSTAEV